MIGKWRHIDDCPHAETRGELIHHVTTLKRSFCKLNGEKIMSFYQGLVTKIICHDVPSASTEPGNQLDGRDLCPYLSLLCRHAHTHHDSLLVEILEVAKIMLLLIMATV